MRAISGNVLERGPNHFSIKNDQNTAARWWVTNPTPVWRTSAWGGRFAAFGPYSQWLVALIGRSAPRRSLALNSISAAALATLATVEVITVRVTRLEKPFRFDSAMDCTGILRVFGLACSLQQHAV
jgi:hypothetical protein